MPRGPNGQKRPADIVSNAVLIGRIATGEISDPKGTHPNRAKGGRAGGAARAKVLSPSKRKAIASKAAKARWGV